MNRSVSRLVIPVVLCLLGACQTTSGPERREVTGSWRSEGLPGTDIRMTLAETVRSVDGAGRWADADGTAAFTVGGALAVDEVSFYFDFDERVDVGFVGFFSGDDTIEGEISGAGFDRVPITFERDDRVP